MKAIIWKKYGAAADSLELREIEKPSPKDNEILVRIHAASVSAGDCELRTLTFPFFIAFPIRLIMGFFRPKDKILGQELAGEVEAVGKDVRQFKVGDEVFAVLGFAMGAYAEYRCIAENSEDDALLLKPKNSSYQEAAVIPVGGLEALHFLKKANIQQGQKLLIIGAGGGIGTLAIQIAKLYGAEVTAIDSGNKLEMLRSIGADHVIDYSREDFTKSGEVYDFVFDIVGKSSLSHSAKVLKEGGAFLMANPNSGTLLQAIWASMTGKQKVIFGGSNERLELLRELRDLVETGKVKAVIDREYPLAEMVAAHQYVESGQKAGCVAIRI